MQLHANSWIGRTAALALVVGFAVSFAGREAPAQTTERVSLTTTCGEGNEGSTRPSISADGRYVAFSSRASNLVPGDTNGVDDIFVFDRAARTVERVSVSSSGLQGNAPSDRPSVSGDGRYVVFYSDSTNLVSGDTNGLRDIFLRDRIAGTTTRISVSSTGVQSNGDSTRPKISADGRFAVFESDATNLVSGDTNLLTDVFLRDLVGGVTTRLSVTTAGLQGDDISNRASISDDGRYVAFKSRATNLVVGDTNAFEDIFVRDTVAGTTERVSFGPGGIESDEDNDRPAISGDGRYVAFYSDATNLVLNDTNGVRDVFVRDRLAGTTTRVSVSSIGQEGNALSEDPEISSDGRYVAFPSLATNLVVGDSAGFDVFVHDLATASTVKVSVNSIGEGGNADSERPVLSATGQFVVFRSYATNLVQEDWNGFKDVFVHDLAPSSLAACQGKDDVDVLYVNGRSGIHTAHLVVVHSTDPVLFTIQKPAAGGNGKFLVHMNAGFPDASTVSPLPAGLGSFCFPLLLPAASPVCVWNNIGKTSQVGASSYFGTPIPDPLKAPVTFLDLPAGDPAHLVPCSRWTIQGLIINPASSSAKGASVTNAVALEFIP